MIKYILHSKLGTAVVVLVVALAATGTALAIGSGSEKTTTAIHPLTQSESTAGALPQTGTVDSVSAPTSDPSVPPNQGSVVAAGTDVTSGTANPTNADGPPVTPPASASPQLKAAMRWIRRHNTSSRGYKHITKRSSHGS